VIIYEPPEDPEVYIHRAGRTGRAGGGGEAISLVGGMEVFGLQRIAKRYDIKLQERPMPSDEDVANFVSQRVTAMLEARLRTRDRLKVERMQRFVTLARSLGENEGELGLLAMLLDDFYHGMLNVPVAPLPAQQPSKQRASSGTGGRKRRPSRRGGRRRPRK